MFVRWRGLVAVAALVGSFWTGLGGYASGAGEGPPRFSLSPAEKTVDLSAGTVQLEVRVEDVPNVDPYGRGMGSFGFTLRYDPGVLSFQSATVGDFLGSTGRQVDCPPAQTDSGNVEFGCATVATGEGPSGAGLLATVLFKLEGGDKTTVNIDDATASDALANPLCRTDGYTVDPASIEDGSAYLTNCAASGASVTVTGGKAEENEGVPPSPTPVTAPAGGSDAGGQLPGGSNSAPTPAGGAGGVGSTGQGRTGTAAGAGRSGGNAQAGSGAGPGANVGNFGTGPQQSDGDGRSLVVGAIAALSAGAALAATGRALGARNTRSMR